MLITPGGCSVDSMQWRQILIGNRDFCLPHLYLMTLLGWGSRQNIAVKFGTEKLEWCGYPMVTKFSRFAYSFRQNPQM